MALQTGLERPAVVTRMPQAPTQCLHRRTPPHLLPSSPLRLVQVEQGAQPRDIGFLTPAAQRGDG